MGGTSVYARHSFVQWTARVGTIAVFLVCAVLYGVPLAVLLGLLASCAYCGVTYVSFTLEGRQWRQALEMSYDKLFSSVYGQGSLLWRRNEDGDRSKRKERGQASLQCHREAQKMIRLIMRDFVLEWYENITTDLEFPDDCQKILEHVALEINVRMQRVDLDQVVHEVFTAVLPYLVAVNEAGQLEYNGVEIFDVKHERCLRRFEENPTLFHRALHSSASETRYYRQLLDALIQSALPDEYRNSDLACMFLREILLRNILEPLVNLICNPDFLNKAIPVILRKADPRAVQTVLDHIEVENKELEQSLLRGRMIQAHRRPPNMRRFHSVSEHYSPSLKPIPVQLSRICSPPQIFPGGPVGNHEEEGSEEVHIGEEVCVEEEEGGEGEGGNPGDKIFTASELESEVRLPFSSSPVSSLGSSSSSLPHEDPPFLGRRDSLPSHNSPSLPRKSELSSRSQTVTKTPPTVAKSTASVSKSVTAAVASSSSVDSDTELVDLAPIFATRYVHIRHGNNAYIGYVFKFPKKMLSPEDQQELGLPSNETHLESVKRYSDFTRLHNQLQKHPGLVKHTHGLDLPDRHGFANVVSKLPFTSKDLDPTALLERKQGLEKYIQSISSRPEIPESALFRDFLKSGVAVLRDFNAHNLHKSRKRKLLGIMKGHSEDMEEAKPLPKRPMESVLSSYLNTSLPLPCRKLNSTTSTVTSKPSLESGRDRTRRPVLVKAATIGESSFEVNLMGDQKRRTLSDSDRALTRGAEDNLPLENESDYMCVDETTPSQIDSRDSCHGNYVHSPTPTLENTSKSDITAATTTPPQAPPHFLTRVKYYLFFLTSRTLYLIRTAMDILHHCSLPFTPHTLETLHKQQHSEHPISDTLLSLGTEASKRHCRDLWATDKSTQIAILTLLGGAIDRFLMKELHMVAEKEQNWMRALYNLRHTLWVEGSKQLDRSPKEKLTEGEREDRKRQAVEAFKKFLPNFLPYVVGPEDYSHAVTHCLECLQNPRINRHFFLRVIDILLPKIVPELHSEEFQKRLARLRTLTSTHAHKIPHSRPSSTYSKKH